MKIDEQKIKVVGRLLLNNRGKLEEGYWPWLDNALRGNREASKKEANKFLIGAMLNRQMDANIVWEKAAELSKVLLEDSPHLWDKILSVPKSKWKSAWRKYKFHRYVDNMSEYVRDNAKIIVDDYQGDARKLWQNQSEAQIKANLRELRGIGPALINMILGALQDTRQISAKNLNVKADVHVCRVLGRVFQERPCQPDEAIRLTKKMYPKNPWVLDDSLYWLGKRRCSAKNPDCENCYLAKQCEYNKRK